MVQYLKDCLLSFKKKREKKQKVERIKNKAQAIVQETIQPEEFDTFLEELIDSYDEKRLIDYFLNYHLDKIARLKQMLKEENIIGRFAYTMQASQDLLFFFKKLSSTEYELEYHFSSFLENFSRELQLKGYFTQKREDGSLRVVYNLEKENNE